MWDLLCENQDLAISLAKCAMIWLLRSICPILTLNASDAEHQMKQSLAVIIKLPSTQCLVESDNLSPLIPTYKKKKKLKLFSLPPNMQLSLLSLSHLPLTDSKHKTERVKAKAREILIEDTIWHPIWYQQFIIQNKSRDMVAASPNVFPLKATWPSTLFCYLISCR